MPPVSLQIIEEEHQRVHLSIWKPAPVQMQCKLQQQPALLSYLASITQLADSLMDSETYNDAVMTYVDQMLLGVTGVLCRDQRLKFVCTSPWISCEPA